MLRRIRDFLRDDSGPTAVEYAVLMALIIVVAIGGIRAFSSSTSTSMQHSSDQIGLYVQQAGS
jgi:pilus assembly protein Flp/PilA